MKLKQMVRKRMGPLLGLVLFSVLLLAFLFPGGRVVGGWLVGTGLMGHGMMERHGHRHGRHGESRHGDLDSKHHCDDMRFDTGALGAVDRSGPSAAVYVHRYRRHRGSRDCPEKSETSGGDLQGVGAAVFLAADDTDGDKGTQTEQADQAGQRLQSLFDKMNELGASDLGPDELRERVAETLVEYVDFTFIARNILGRGWRTLTDDQKRAYNTTFQTWLTAQLARHLRNFSQNAEVEFVESRQVRKDVFTDVQVEYEGEQTRVSIRQRQRGSETFRIIDVVVEEISLLTGWRSEFQPFFRENGIEALIQRLEEATSAPLPEETASS